MANIRASMLLWSSLIVVAVLCAIFSAKYTLLKLRVAFADGQVATFEVAKARVDNVTDPKELSAQLEYVLNYYPSGTKQVTGTHLDRVVEVARSNAIAVIIWNLRRATGKNLGDKPQQWLKEYPPNN